MHQKLGKLSFTEGIGRRPLCGWIIEVETQPFTCIHNVIWRVSERRRCVGAVLKVQNSTGSLGAHAKVLPRISGWRVRSGAPSDRVGFRQRAFRPETGSQAGEVEFVTFIAGEPVDDFADDRVAHRGGPGGT